MFVLFCCVVFVRFTFDEMDFILFYVKIDRGEQTTYNTTTQATNNITLKFVSLNEHNILIQRAVIRHVKKKILIFKNFFLCAIGINTIFGKFWIQRPQRMKHKRFQLQIEGGSNYF